MPMQFPLLSEQEVETAFVNYIHHAKDRMKVIGRQVRLPMGILDVLILARDGSGYHTLVTEIKKDVIDERACAQLLGYMGQVERITKYAITRNCYGSQLSDFVEREDSVNGWLVGRSITPLAERMIATLPIGFIKYTVQEHGIIDFDFQSIRFFHWFTIQDGYNMPDALKVVAASVSHNAKQAMLRHADFGNSSDIYEAATQGKDRQPQGNPTQSLSIWERSASDNKTVEES